LESHPELDPLIGQFAVLMGEVLITSPEFAWAAGNIWSDVDPEAVN